MKWIEALAEQRKRNTGFVLVTILNVEGSSPRGEQSKMLITDTQIFDSIGGGNLEYQAMEKARQLLEQKRESIEVHEYTLGQDLTQCCGGRVELLFECFPRCEFQVVLCGAGHVGTALVKILADLPCQVHWLDSRAQQLSNAFAETGAPSNVTTTVITDPHMAIEQAPPGALYLVMTHSHETDFALCEAILARKDLRFCGLIGSQSKAVKFKNRLSRKSYTDEEVARLTSPIGLEIGAGKLPMEVAVAVAAQLLQIFSTSEKKLDDETESETTPGLISNKASC